MENGKWQIAHEEKEEQDDGTVHGKSHRRTSNFQLPTSNIELRVGKRMGANDSRRNTWKIRRFMGSLDDSRITLWGDESRVFGRARKRGNAPHSYEMPVKRFGVFLFL